MPASGLMAPTGVPLADLIVLRQGWAQRLEKPRASAAGHLAVECLQPRPQPMPPQEQKDCGVVCRWLEPQADASQLSEDAAHGLRAEELLIDRAQLLGLRRGD